MSGEVEAALAVAEERDDGYGVVNQRVNCVIDRLSRVRVLGA